MSREAVMAMLANLVLFLIVAAVCCTAMTVTSRSNECRDLGGVPRGAFAQDCAHSRR